MSTIVSKNTPASLTQGSAVAPDALAHAEIKCTGIEERVSFPSGNAAFILTRAARERFFAVTSGRGVSAHDLLHSAAKEGNITDALEQVLRPGAKLPPIERYEGFVSCEVPVPDSGRPEKSLFMILNSEGYLRLTKKIGQMLAAGTASNFNAALREHLKQEGLTKMMVTLIGETTLNAQPKPKQRLAHHSPFLRTVSRPTSGGLAD